MPPKIKWNYLKAVTIYFLDSLYWTIVRTSKFFDQPQYSIQRSRQDCCQCNGWNICIGFDFRTIVRRYILRTLEGLSHPNVGFLQGFAPAARRRELAGGGTSAGDGTSTGIRAKQCTTPVSNPLLCARICYLTAPTRTSLGFVFTTDYGCMMCRLSKIQIYIALKRPKILFFLYRKWLIDANSKIGKTQSQNMSWKCYRK